eukprot:SM000014S00311  [mRNA]  locus=s14:671739:673046:- [translate_table: standard]
MAVAMDPPLPPPPTAYDVSLDDDSWPSSIFEVVGNTTASWDKLESNGPSLEHSFLLKPKEKGPYLSPPAIVKYRVATKSDLQTAVSTPLPELDVLSDKPAEPRLLWLYKLVGQYVPLVVVVTIVALFVMLLMSPSKPKAKYSKKRR